jgi:hypothetical protein
VRAKRVARGDNIRDYLLRGGVTTQSDGVPSVDKEAGGHSIVLQGG